MQCQSSSVTSYLCFTCISKMIDISRNSKHCPSPKLALFVLWMLALQFWLLPILLNLNGIKTRPSQKTLCCPTHCFQGEKSSCLPITTLWLSIFHFCLCCCSYLSPFIAYTPAFFSFQIWSYFPDFGPTRWNVW